MLLPEDNHNSCNHRRQTSKWTLETYLNLQSSFTWNPKHLPRKYGCSTQNTLWRVTSEPENPWKMRCKTQVMLSHACCIALFSAWCRLWTRSSPKIESSSDKHEAIPLVQLTKPHIGLQYSTIFLRTTVQAILGMARCWTTSHHVAQWANTKFPTALVSSSPSHAAFLLILLHAPLAKLTLFYMTATPEKKD